MTEEEILRRYSTPGLRRGVLTRQAKRLNMEFDAQYHGWTQKQRDEFLDGIFGPEEKKS